MADQIRISPDQMRGRAGEYNQEAEKVDDVINKMDSLLNALEAEWEGDAQKAYTEKFNELRPGFVEARDLINQIADSLNKTADLIEEQDRNIANAYRS